MGKYIGNSAPYGVYEKQSFDLSEGVTKYTLTYRVGYSTSLLVVWAIQGATTILEPEVDYVLVDGGSAIQLLTVVPYIAGNNFEERLYAVYLGRELSVPTPATSAPLLVQKSNVSGTTVHITDAVYLEPSGLIVIKDGQLLRHTTDFTVSSDGHSITLEDAASNATFDVYVVSGIKRLETTDLVGQLTTENFHDKSVTANKLNLRFSDYSESLVVQEQQPGVVGQIGNLIVHGVQVQEALYMTQGDLSDITGTGVPIKVRVRFTANLSGAPDNKVRISLPRSIKNVSSVIGGNAVIVNNKTIESGILRWSGVQSVDIYRPSATNYELTDTAGTYTFEAVFEYIGSQS